MSHGKVIVLDYDLPGQPVEDVLSNAGFSPIRAESHDLENIGKWGAGAVGLVVQWAQVTPAMMDQLPDLKAISRLGIGYDMIDVDAAGERGIAVMNAPDYCIEEVAAHTIAMIMDAVRGITRYDRDVKADTWQPVVPGRPARRPSTMTVGVVGFGRIGRLVATYSSALGFSVVVSDPYADGDVVRADGHEVVELPELLELSDVVTLHAPLNDETHHMMNQSTFALMRPGATVVNTCRGGLIDEAALAEALESSHVGLALLDVYDSEPLAANSALRALPNTILTPHSAWFSPESLIDLPVHAARNIVAFLSGDPVPSVVNRHALEKPAAGPTT
jgi:D-3-phosphoglycerate dehydrogenase